MTRARAGGRFAAVLLLALTAATSALAADSFSTRHGTLTVDGRNELRFRGRAFEPRVAAANGLDFVRRFQRGAADIVLLRTRGGTACPFQYRLVTVEAGGAQASEAFGTCAEMKSVRATDAGIVVDMPDYRGPHDGAAARAAAAKRSVRFVYAEGRLTRTP